MRSTLLIHQIALPNVPAHENVTAALALESRAAEGQLPPELDRWIVELRDARKELQSGLALLADTPSDARTERLDLGNGWVAFESFLQGHATLPLHAVPEQQAAARALVGAVFASSGLTFLAGTTHEELFGASSTLLQVLDGDTGKANVALVGAEVFVNSLHLCQERFGLAAGFLRPTDDPDIAGLLEKARDAMRKYVGKVMSYGLDGPEEAKRADQLLQPWAKWTENHPGGGTGGMGGGGGASDPTTTVAETPAPDDAPSTPDPTTPGGAPAEVVPEPPLAPEDNPFVDDEGEGARG